jgi:hypothetical protein
VTTFNAKRWAEQYREARRFFGCPGTRDGIAALHADLLALHFELFNELAKVQPITADAFRPELFLVLSAVRQATATEGGAV